MSSSNLRPVAAPRGLAVLQVIDRRIIYLIVFLLLLGPLIFPFSLPLSPAPEVEGFYEAIQNAPKDKAVVVGMDFGSGTMGENMPQTRALVEHLFREGRKVVFISFEAQGPDFASRIAEEPAKKYNRKYGEDYVVLGYKAITSETAAATFQSFARDIGSIFRQDMKGTPVSQIPIMQKVRKIRDVAIVAEFTGASYLDYYVQFLYGPFRTPLVQGCTAIVGPEQYPRLRAGQLKGLLVGMSGAAEYESKLNYKGMGTAAMNSQSLGHFLIIGLIILGNIGMAAARRHRPVTIEPTAGPRP